MRPSQTQIAAAILATVIGGTMWSRVDGQPMTVARAKAIAAQQPSLATVRSRLRDLKMPATVADAYKSGFTGCIGPGPEEWMRVIWESRKTNTA